MIKTSTGGYFCYLVILKFTKSFHCRTFPHILQNNKMSEIQLILLYETHECVWIYVFWIELNKYFLVSIMLLILNNFRNWAFFYLLKLLLFDIEKKENTIKISKFFIKFFNIIYILQFHEIHRKINIIYKCLHTEFRIENML